MAAAAAAPNPNGLEGMCCSKAAAVKGSLKPRGKWPPKAAAVEVRAADEAVVVVVEPEGRGGGEVTEEGVLDAEGVRIELTLKSDDGFGEVNTEVVVVDPVEAGGVEAVGGGGGVFGGVVGEAEPNLVELLTSVSSISTGLCSWSLILKRCQSQLKKVAASVLFKQVRF